METAMATATATGQDGRPQAREAVETLWSVYGAQGLYMRGLQPTAIVGGFVAAAIAAKPGDGIAHGEGAVPILAAAGATLG